MTFGSLFAGIGGFDLGFERAGMRCVWQCEIDKPARWVLNRHFPAAKVYADVTAMKPRKAERVDVVCGGFPCQDLSVAGKRGGLAGNRSGLFWEMLRIVDGIRPAILVWENVPGLFSSDDRRDFARVLRGLADIGYSGGWRVLDTQFFGCPQRRKRVFGVFARGRAGAGRAAEILALSESRKGHSSTRRKAEQRVAATLRSRVASPGVSAPGRGGEDDDNLIVAHTLTGNGFDASEDGTGRGIPLVVQTIGAHHARNCPDDQIVVAFQQNQRDELRVTPIVGALSSQPGMKQQTFVAYTLKAAHRGVENGWQGNYVTNEIGVRRLMPVECLRLQGFPDDWLDLSPTTLADSTKFRLIGNAVSVPVAQWIGRRIMEAAA